MIKYFLFVIQFILFLPASEAQQNDTIRIYFDTGKKEFNSKSSKKLDSLFYHDLINTTKTAFIVGYTDYVGGELYNDKLSKARAKYVADYINGMGFKRSDIKMCVGKGEIDRDTKTKGGVAVDRRVDLVINSRAKKLQTNKTVLPKPQIAKLTTAKPGQTLVLDNIYFYAGRHVIREESLQELDNLYQALIAKPTMRIQIEGHICCVKAGRDALDEDTFELALSENRAKFIYEYLLKKGITSNRLKYRGFARTHPLVDPELTAEDEDKNRRVEIRVLQ